MNLLPLVARRDGAVIEGTDGPAVLAGALRRRPCSACGPSISACNATAAMRRAVESVEYLGGDSLITCRLGETSLAVRQSGQQSGWPAAT